MTTLTDIERQRIDKTLYATRPRRDAVAVYEDAQSLDWISVGITVRTEKMGKIKALVSLTRRKDTPGLVSAITSYLDAKLVEAVGK